MAEQQSPYVGIEHHSHDIILKGGDIQKEVQGFLRDRKHSARIFTCPDSESCCVEFHPQRYTSEHMQSVLADLKDMLNVLGYTTRVEPDTIVDACLH